MEESSEVSILSVLQTNFPALSLHYSLYQGRATSPDGGPDMEK